LAVTRSVLSAECTYTTVLSGSTLTDRQFYKYNEMSFIKKN
jgi:hypothetical protein